MDPSLDLVGDNIPKGLKPTEESGDGQDAPPEWPVATDALFFTLDPPVGLEGAWEAGDGPAKSREKAWARTLARGHVPSSSLGAAGHCGSRAGLVVARPAGPCGPRAGRALARPAGPFGPMSPGLGERWPGQLGPLAPCPPGLGERWPGQLSPFTLHPWGWASTGHASQALCPQG
ncbi:hypothetical protein llap_16505 [Limosa lapponica baueri]|uniref:Uncharacterized protein n=1 Tax=Limosa lapponica baueri TaxID=1758121 RepID=A0A2I0THG2_LIMLA|nr:hypothetical protein llap_16505 [Limosa lapponica baueri]